MNNCKQCGIEITRPQFCSRKCSGKYRQLNVYGDKYTIKWRGLTPRNFLMTLSKKKISRRHLSPEFLMSLYENQNGKCAISGREMTYITGSGRITTNMSIDRIDSSLGYEESNLQLVCIQANKMKQELSTNDLISWCNDIIRKNNGY